MSVALVVVDPSGVHVGILGLYADLETIDRKLIADGWSPPYKTSGSALGAGSPYYSKPGHVRLVAVPMEPQP